MIFPASRRRAVADSDSAQNVDNPPGAAAGRVVAVAPARRRPNGAARAANYAPAPESSGLDAVEKCFDSSGGKWGKTRIYSLVYSLGCCF